MKDDEFLKKFTNRIEQMGKDGIVGILKNTREPINISKKRLKFSINNYKNSYQKNYLDSNSLPLLYKSNLNTNNSSYLDPENDISNYNKENNEINNVVNDVNEDKYIDNMYWNIGIKSEIQDEIIKELDL